jgi:hypothetical protein
LPCQSDHHFHVGFGPRDLGEHASFPSLDKTSSFQLANVSLPAREVRRRRPAPLKEQVDIHVFLSEVIGLPTPALERISEVGQLAWSKYPRRLETEGSNLVGYSPGVANREE